GLDVLAGQNAHDAGGGARRRDIDALDPRMRMGREHDHGMGLMRQLDIVDKAATTGEKAHVLDPAHRLTNAIGMGVEMLLHGAPSRPWRRTALRDPAIIHIGFIFLIKWPLGTR